MNDMATGSMRLDRTLEALVEAHWDELMPVAGGGWIQVEYRTGSDGLLQYLKIWASMTRGRWDLVCEQWTTAAWSHVPGLQFSPGYYSEGLGHALEVVSRHQKTFAQLAGPDQNGLLPISAPQEDERRAAKSWMTEVLATLGSSPTEELVTAWTGGKNPVPAEAEAPTAAA
jgi:hypothetical protein